MGRVLSAVQHRCNPLHVYCRLIEKGVSRDVSIRLSRVYEASIYWWLISSLTGLSLWFSRLGTKGCAVGAFSCFQRLTSGRRGESARELRGSQGGHWAQIEAKSEVLK